MKSNNQNEGKFGFTGYAENWNGRLAMIAISGFVAQELVDGKGIVEHWTS